MSKCPVCNARGNRPCLDSYGNPIAQWHTARAISAATERRNHAAEATRLRAAAKGQAK